MDERWNNNIERNIQIYKKMSGYSNEKLGYVAGKCIFLGQISCQNMNKIKFWEIRTLAVEED